MNNWTPTFGEEELVDLVLSVAAGELKKPGLVEIFESLRAARGALTALREARI